MSPIQIPKNNSISAFALILDINGFTKMVANPDKNFMAQFIRDVLYGSIRAIENNRGDVVGFMGDALFGIITDAEDVFKACAAIAKDVDQQCEYHSNNSSAYPFAPKGISLKIGIEYGVMDVSEINSNFLGAQKLFIGEAINYAARITTAHEKGNRCLVGPKAFEMGLADYCYKEGYGEVKGKNREGKYVYYKMNLGDIWIEGKSKVSYWG